MLAAPDTPALNPIPIVHVPLLSTRDRNPTATLLAPDRFHPAQSPILTLLSPALLDPAFEPIATRFTPLFPIPALAPNAFKLSLVFPDPALHPNALTNDPVLLRAALEPNALTDDPVLFSPALGPIKFTIDPELLNPVRFPNKFTLDGVPTWLLDIPTINRKGLLCIVTETLLMAISPARLDKVTAVIVAVGAVKFPTTVRSPLIVVADNVASPPTLNALLTFAADTVIKELPAEILPPTVRRFETIAPDRVASPVMVAACDTLRHKIDTVAFAAEIDTPPTLRL